jgi:peroxiredoxin (alkyl hydroperoxide reductase subunit C)
MKKILLICFLMVTFMTCLFAQESQTIRIPLIGEPAPAFTAESTTGPITFPDNQHSKWTILFSHPADFTAVCSSEILELAAVQDDFERLNTRLMVISTDAVSSHIEWVKSLEAIKYKDREPMKIKFPLISDKSLEISKKYGMIHSYSSTTKDVRGVFIIDPDNKIEAVFFYPMNVGRSIDEIKRTLVALQTAGRHNVLIPANWKPGQDVMIPSPTTSADADKLLKKNDPELYPLTWYMWFKKLRD